MFVRAYIGCDLCQDWFHFTCVGLNPDTPPEEIGDSWLCSECRKAEAKAKDEVYCLCRTPYDPARCVLIYVYRDLLSLWMAWIHFLCLISDHSYNKS